MAARGELRRAIRRAAAWAAASLGVGLAPAAALAHDSKALGAFWGGFLLPAFHLDALLAALALALRGEQWRTGRHVYLPLGVLAGAAAGAVAALAGLALPWPDATLRLCAGAVALLTVLRVSAPAAPSLAAGALVGAIYGQTALVAERGQLDQPLLFALGLCAAPFVLSGALALLAERLPERIAAIGVRVVSSWIAAVALLATALGALAPR